MPDNNQNVVISFVGDTSQLKPVENSLDSIIAKDAEVGAAWKKTSDAMNSQTATNTATTNKLAKSIDDLATAAKSGDKAVIGGAYAAYLKQIQTQLGLTRQELVAYVQDARKAAQQNIFSAGTDEEVDAITLSIEAMNDQLKLLGASEDGAGSKTDSLRSQIRQAKEELIQMAAAGLQGTPAFVALQNHAGELDDQMKDLNLTVQHLGSDTKNIDGLISLATGIAGGFAVAQGAAALFGTESEDVQKALLKVNAAMAILQGLQQVGNVLQKESAASLLITNLFWKQQAVAQTEATVAATTNVVATEAVVVAEGEQVVATEAATVAQTELNTAMALNPIGIVIAGVAALVAVIAIWASNNRAAEKTQLDLNDAVRKATIYLNSDLKSLDQFTAKQKALASQQGASAAELTKIEGEAGNKRLQLINNEITAAANALNNAKVVDKETADSYKALSDKKFALEQQLQDELNSLQVKGIEYRKALADGELKAFISNQEAKVLATRSGSVAEKNAQIAELQATQADRIKLAKEGAATIAEADAAATKIQAEDARAISDTQLALYAYLLKSQTAMSEAALATRKTDILKSQTDTIASIEAVTAAEIKAIKARTAEQIKGSPNLSSGERAQIYAQENEQILELQNQLQIKLLDIRKAGINAELILAQKGTAQEYNLKIQALENERAIELAATELTAEQTAEINAKTQKARQEALRAYNEAQLQNQISIDNASLDQFGISEAQKLTITLKRLDEQRDLEISQAENNAAKIAEVNAKYDKAALDARKATIAAVLADNLNTLAIFSADSQAANERILSQDKSTYDQRLTASKGLLSAELLQLDLQAAAEKKNLDDGLITQHVYDVAVQDINNKRTAATISNEERITAATLKEIEKRSGYFIGTAAIIAKALSDTLGTTGFATAISSLNDFGVKVQDTLAKIKAGILSTEDGVKAIVDTGIGALQGTIDQIFADSTASRAQALTDQIALLENAKAKEVDNENLTAQQKQDIQTKYAQKEKQAKIAAFNADKKAKEEEAEINGFLAVSKTFADLGFLAALPFVALQLAETAIIVSKIASAKTPQFKLGEVDIQGPGTGTSDSIMARISAGESVINANATAKWKHALEAINSNQFEPYLMKLHREFAQPHIPEELMHAAVAQEPLDYDKLATAMANKMRGIIPGQKSVHVNIDRDGIHTIAQDGMNKTEFKNNRYSFK